MNNLIEAGFFELIAYIIVKVVSLLLVFHIMIYIFLSTVMV